MPTPTSRLALLKPSQDDPFVTQDIADNWQKIDDMAALDDQGTLASRPAAGVEGRYYYATDTGLVYRDNGAAWTVVGQSDHGALGGLGDDDHPQYLNGARHTTALHNSLAIDHGSLGGRGDDDHTLYVRTDAVRDFTATPQVNNQDMWHAGNDGPGSGLDADLLDGQHGSSFASSGHSHGAATEGGIARGFNSSTSRLLTFNNARLLTVTVAVPSGWNWDAICTFSALGENEDTNPHEHRCWASLDGVDFGTGYGSHYWAQENVNKGHVPREVMVTYQLFISNRSGTGTRSFHFYTQGSGPGMYISKRHATVLVTRR